MTRQTWTALVAAIVFVLCAGGLALIPVPFVTWTPGTVTNVLGDNGGKPIIRVSGVPTYPSTGVLDLTTVSETTADASLRLPEALLAYWLPHRDTLPRENVYPSGKSADQVDTEEVQQMQTSQQDAQVAALRQAGIPVTERVQIGAVTVGGPAQDVLRPGDFIDAVDGQRITTLAQVQQLVTSHDPGDTVQFTIERSGKTSTVGVVVRRSTNDPMLVSSGIEVQLGYQYPATVDFGVDPGIGGPSAGLIFALGIYERVTPGDLIDGRRIAGTGEIDADGDVAAIGGIQEKIAGAERAGAGVFLVPAANCDDLAGVHTTMRLVKVATLHDAITALTDLKTPAKAAQVPAC